MRHSLGHQLVAYEIEASEAHISTERLVAQGVPREHISVNCCDFSQRYAVHEQEIRGVVVNSTTRRYQNYSRSPRA